MVDVGPESLTTTKIFQRRLTTSCRNDDLLLVNHEQQLVANSNRSNTLDKVASDSDTTVSEEDSEPESDATWTVTEPSGRNEQLFVPDMIGGGRTDSRLTVEDIYIEAMTMDAEVRVFRRRLDAAGRRELSRIINFCRDALHRKLLLRSVEHAQGSLGAGTSARRSVSSDNLTVPPADESKPLELIAETSI